MPLEEITLALFAACNTTWTLFLIATFRPSPARSSTALIGDWQPASRETQSAV